MEFLQFDQVPELRGKFPEIVVGKIERPQRPGRFFDFGWDVSDVVVGKIEHLQFGQGPEAARDAREPVAVEMDHPQFGQFFEEAVREIRRRRPAEAGAAPTPSVGEVEPFQVGEALEVAFAERRRVLQDWRGDAHGRGGVVARVQFPDAGEVLRRHPPACPRVARVPQGLQDERLGQGRAVAYPHRGSGAREGAREGGQEQGAARGGSVAVFRRHGGASSATPR